MLINLMITFVSCYLWKRKIYEIDMKSKCFMAYSSYENTNVIWKTKTAFHQRNQNDCTLSFYLMKMTKVFYYYFSYASINSIHSTSTPFISFDGCLEMRSLMMIRYFFSHVSLHPQQQHFIIRHFIFIIKKKVAKMYLK